MCILTRIMFASNALSNHSLGAHNNYQPFFEVSVYYQFTEESWEKVSTESQE
jgi:hypothetical protein